MPTYDYICEDCGHCFEQFQSITAKALRKCPVCGKMKLKRLIGSGSGVIFKGAGFYETDYRSDSYKKAAKKETDSVKTGDSETKKKTEKTPSKTDGKSESKSKSQSKPA